MEAYISKYGKRLYGLCLTLCADKVEADDLYQETWLKALMAMSRYDRARNFEPWLTRICVNTFRNRLRRLARAPFFNGFATTKEKDDAMEACAAPDAEDGSAIREAVARMPEKLRLAVILFYFEDMDAAKVADVLKIPVGTVKSRLSKARLLLKEALNDEADL